MNSPKLIILLSAVSMTAVFATPNTQELSTITMTAGPYVAQISPITFSSSNEISFPITEKVLPLIFNKPTQFDFFNATQQNFMLEYSKSLSTPVKLCTFTLNVGNTVSTTGGCTASITSYTTDDQSVHLQIQVPGGIKRKIKITPLGSQVNISKAWLTYAIGFPSQQALMQIPLSADYSGSLNLPENPSKTTVHVTVNYFGETATCSRSLRKIPNKNKDINLEIHSINATNCLISTTLKHTKNATIQLNIEDAGSIPFAVYQNNDIGEPTGLPILCKKTAYIGTYQGSDYTCAIKSVNKSSPITLRLSKVYGQTCTYTATQNNLNGQTIILKQPSGFSKPCVASLSS